MAAFQGIQLIFVFQMGFLEQLYHTAKESNDGFLKNNNTYSG